jgi:hypothetical protein
MGAVCAAPRAGAFAQTGVTEDTAATGFRQLTHSSLPEYRGTGMAMQSQ